jgi:diguanylate cyclase (GGDEF)-like protein
MINTRLPQQMPRLILMGFALLIGLMLLLMLNSVSHMRQQNSRVTEIVELRNRKIQLVVDLLESIHNRHSSLVYQVFVEDPFEQDEHFQQYIKWGYEVGKTRNELRDMPLDDFEQANFAEQDKLIKTIASLHDQISDLARRGDADAARELIAGPLRPLNLTFTAIVIQLEKHERELIETDLKQTKVASRDAINLDLWLGGALILLACLIAAITYRQLNRYSSTICDQMLALEDTSRQLEHQATHDSLTGLPNRSLFYRRLLEAMTHACQEELLATVLYIDLNKFKPVNDLHGHDIGDALLKEVSKRLQAAVRNTDTVARLGGDEFGIVLLGLGDERQIQQVKADIHAKMQVPLEIKGIRLFPGCSCGHATYPLDGSNLDELLKTADSRMYTAKHQGAAVNTDHSIQ